MAKYRRDSIETRTWNASRIGPGQFAAVASSTRHEYEVCTNEYHKHADPVHEMFAVNYNGHRVSTTRSGSTWSVRIDNNPLTDRHGLSEAERNAYIERMTS